MSANPGGGAQRNRALRHARWQTRCRTGGAHGAEQDRLRYRGKDDAGGRQRSVRTQMSPRRLRLERLGDCLLRAHASHCSTPSAARCLLAISRGPFHHRFGSRRSTGRDAI
eukprot:CAMPEP_0170429524 /NCGR_PEP_ID=MMETSP0117_2-20130122/40357_1 /TAXON_ID=400756 /ORGANISM="Durinskia baltica, Strain CSIRO CS-38" /LENGTH=110 /DNA_ID=CAMNT_0010688905 /DNA_START=145 /DNA_END=478 /DNA_ORIENTATION=+